jgi:hypothetical protein
MAINAPQPQTKVQQLDLRSRLRRTMLVWFLLGEVVGMCTAPLHLGLAGVLAGAISGPIITFVFGLFFGLLGSNVRLTLLGSSFGAAIATAAIWIRGDVSNPGLFIAVGVLNGALVGATCSSFCQATVWIISKALAGKPRAAASRIVS